MEHANTDYPRRERFSTIGQGQEAFQAAQLRGIKVGFIFSRRKPLGSETTKCPSLAKEFFKWLKETL
jgi:hypothetical protein